jgi:hypothetical protein
MIPRRSNLMPSAEVLASASGISLAASADALHPATDRNLLLAGVDGIGEHLGERLVFAAVWLVALASIIVGAWGMSW